MDLCSHLGDLGGRGEQEKAPRHQRGKVSLTASVSSLSLPNPQDPRHLWVSGGNEKAGHSSHPPHLPADTQLLLRATWGSGTGQDRVKCGLWPVPGNSLPAWGWPPPPHAPPPAHHHSSAAMPLRALSPPNPTPGCPLHRMAFPSSCSETLKSCLSSPQTDTDII